MNMWLERITRSLKDAEGQDLLEYSMLVALIAVVAVGRGLDARHHHQHRVVASHCCQQHLTHSEPPPSS